LRSLLGLLIPVFVFPNSPPVEALAGFVFVFPNIPVPAVDVDVLNRLAVVVVAVFVFPNNPPPVDALLPNVFGVVVFPKRLVPVPVFAPDPNVPVDFV